MKLFSIDVKVFATMYVKAETEEQAIEVINRWKNTGCELPTGDCEAGGDPIQVNGDRYSRLMPDVSFSPAITIVGPEDSDTPELVEDFDAEDEEEAPKSESAHSPNSEHPEYREWCFQNGYDPAEEPMDLLAKITLTPDHSATHRTWLANFIERESAQ